MAMQVYNHAQLDVLVELGHLFFGLPHLGVVELVLADPLAVQVHACQTAPLIPIDHSVHIDHRDYFKHEIIPQQFSLERIT